jgi:hypothetical protein
VKYVFTVQELMDMHVRALFTHDARSRLLFVNETGSGVPAPRLFFGRTRDGNLWRFRADLPESLVGELEALCADEPVSTEFDSQPLHLDAYVHLLEAHAPVRKMWTGLHITSRNTPGRRGRFSLSRRRTPRVYAEALKSWSKNCRPPSPSSHSSKMVERCLSVEAFA